MEDYLKRRFDDRTRYGGVLLGGAGLSVAKTWMNNF